MAVMKLNSRMIEYQIWIKAHENASWRDVTKPFGPFVSSIRIRHGVSEGSRLNKRNYHSSPYELAITNHARGKKMTSPSELDMQFMSNSYLEDFFWPGVMLRIYFKSPLSKWKLAFEGEVRNYPYGGAKDMVNYNVRAYGKEILFSNIERNRTFKAKTLTQKSLLLEIIAPNGFELEYNSKSDLPIKRSSVVQKGKTDMQMLDELAKRWKCHWYFDDEKTIVWCDGADTYTVGDSKTGAVDSYGPYILNYRTELGICNVDSVDWAQNSAPGGSDTEPAAFSYNEAGDEKNAYKIISQGKTWRLKKQYLDMVKEDGVSFGAFSAFAAELTLRGHGYEALHKFYEVASDDDPDAVNSEIPSGGDHTGLELTIMLSEGDVDLSAPRTAVLTCGDSLGDIRLNTNLPVWLFQYSTNAGAYNSTPLNIKESVLTFENGMLKTELKCTPRAINWETKPKATAK